MTTTSTHTTTPVVTGQTAGALLLGVAAAAGIAAAGMSGVVAGDPSATAGALAEGGPRVGLAVLGYLAAFLLDVAVAAVFYALLRSVHRTVALTAAALRAVYSAAAVALVVLLLGPAALPGGTGIVGLEASALSLFGESFTMVLTIFGAHLALLGWLLWRSGGVPRWLAALVTAGGAAYVVHTAVLLLAPDAEPTVAPALAVLAFGELLLALRLVIRGLRPRTAV